LCPRHAVNAPATALTSNDSNPSIRPSGKARHGKQLSQRLVQLHHQPIRATEPWCDGAE
jgi:hypothetical protein